LSPAGHFTDEKSLNASRSQFPRLRKLSQLGITELLVQVKASDARYNIILAEFKDPESRLAHQMWIPVANCRTLEQPLGVPASAATARTLSKDFHETTVQLVSTYARQTLQQLFQSLQEKEKTTKILQMPEGVNLDLEKLVCWSVWEAFNSDPLNGW
jgi:hypothetical protein